MPYEIKNSINLYNLMLATRIVRDNRIYWFSTVDNRGQTRRKLLFLFSFSPTLAKIILYRKTPLLIPGTKSKKINKKWI